MTSSTPPTSSALPNRRLMRPTRPVAPGQDDLPAPLTIEEIAEEHRVNDFCQTVLARQSESRDSAFFEDHRGLLKRRQPFNPDTVEVRVPRTLRARLLCLCHNLFIAGTRAGTG